MSEEIFSRWQDPTIEKLQQENKQLKEQVDNCISNEMKQQLEISSLRKENKQLKEELKNLEEINNDKSNLIVDDMKELLKYKTVLNEIREYINNYDVFKEFSFPLMKRDEENQVKSSIDYEFQTSIKKSLLQILDFESMSYKVEE